MIDNINNKSVSEAAIKFATDNMVEKSVVTKTEASLPAGMNQTSASARQNFYLDIPQVSNSALQADTAVNVIKAISSNLMSLMQLKDSVMPSGIVKNSAVANESTSSSSARVFDILVLLISIANLNRERQATERQVAVQRNVTSLQNQADELKHQATIQTIAAVGQGLLAVATSGLGIMSSVKSAKSLKSEIDGNQLLKGHQTKLDQEMAKIRETKGFEGAKVQRAELREGVKNINTDISNTKIETQLSGRQFETQASKQQMIKASSDGAGQVMNTSVNVEQTKSQAASKEEEIDATRAQAEKQRSDDNNASLESLIASLLSIFRAQADSNSRLMGNIII